MKHIIASILVALMPALVFAQDHGHSHGAGGETEHMYPILGVFALLIIVGAVIYFLNNKKK